MVFIGIIIFAYLVFTNPDSTQVPNVVGQELSTAQTKIEGAGFKVGEVKEVEDDSVDTGKVVKTDPTAGTTRKEGSSIDIYVSSGSKGFALKDYKGKNYKDAIEDLTSNYGVSEDQIDIQHVEDDSAEEEKSYLKVQVKTSLSILRIVRPRLSSVWQLLRQLPCLM